MIVNKPETLNIPINHLPNLLIVDDDLEQLMFLEFVLKKIKINLIKAESGQEALKKTKGLELALAIIDVRMSEMNGYELALKMNEERSEEKVPIIFLTASHITEKQIFKGYGSGAVDYIFKPVDNNILLCKVNVFLDLFNQKQTIILNATYLKKYADELTRVNATLQKNEEKYRSYVDNAPDGVFIADETGRYVEVNQAACRITGYSKKELLTMSILDIVQEESVKDGLVQFRKLIKTGTSKADLLFKHKNGSVRWWNVGAVKLSDKRFLGFAKDVTERKIAEQALKVSEEKYRTMLIASPDGIFIIDLNGIITDVSEIGLEIFGTDNSSELIGKHFLRFVPSEEKKIIRGVIEKTMNEGIVQNIEIKIRKKNQSILLIEISSTLIQDP